MARTRIVGGEGLLAHSGKDLGTSDWQAMTYERIAKFADQATPAVPSTWGGLKLRYR